MADVNFNRGYKQYIKDTSIVPFKAGTISIAEDSQEIYIDANNNQRVKITDVVDITGINNPNLIAGKIYINGTKLQKVENNKLVDVSSTGNSVINVNNIIDSISDTEGKIYGSYGKSGDFIIDDIGNVGIVKSISDGYTNVQIISMRGSDKVRVDYFIYVGDAIAGKCIGTINDPYNRYSQFPDDLITKLRSNQTVVINCMNHFMIDNSISGWQNVIINGNGFRIDFRSDDNYSIFNCSNIKLMNCDIFSSDYMEYCDNIILENCTLNDYFKITLNNYICFKNCKQKNRGGLTGSSNNIDIINCNFKYVNLDGIKVNGISNINIIDSTIESFYTNHFYGNGIINIRNSKFDEMTIVPEIYQLNLISGKCTSDLAQSILAANINLGTFEFATTPIFGDSSIIVDRVGLSSKQVYDENNKQYIKDYIANDNNTLTESDKKSNLEFHLKAIDDSLTSAHDDINELTEETNKITKAFVTTDSFKMLDELDNIEWKPGNVVKYYGDAIISLDTTFEVTPILYEEIKVPVISESGTVYNDYVSLTFPLNNASYYCTLGDKVSITHNTIIGEITYPFDYEFEIYSIDKNKANDTRNENGYFKARFKKSDFKTEDEISDDLTKFVNCTYVRSLSISKNDRLIRLTDGWDKLTAASDDAGNYYIVNDHSSLSYIKSDTTRPVGTLGYVVEEDKVYKWFYNEESKVYEWVEFSSGSGGGGGTGSSYILQYCKPSDAANPLYPYNYQNTLVPSLFYNETDTKLTFNYYYQNSVAQDGTYILYFKGEKITQGKLLKGPHTVDVDLTKIKLEDSDGSNYYSLYFYLGNNVLSILDKDGNILTDCLKYSVSKSNIGVAYKSGSSDYDFTLIKEKTTPDKLHEIILDITKSKNIKIESFKINDIEQEDILDVQNQKITYKMELLENINSLKVNIVYTIEGSIQQYYYNDNKFIYALDPNSMYLYDEEFTTEITTIKNITMNAKLLTNLSNRANIRYYIDDEENAKTIEPTNWNVLSVTRNNIITCELEHGKNVAGNYTLYYEIIQYKDGKKYSSGIRNQVISIQELDDVTGPVMSGLVMNFDINRTNTTDINSNEWLSSVNDYKIKFNNLFDNENFVGYRVKETENASNKLSYVGDKYVRFFGDTYGNIVSFNNTEESDYDISSLNDALLKNPDTGKPQGYTIEFLFRARFTGDLNELAISIGNLLNVSFDTIQFADFNNVNFVENDWMHITLVVNSYVNSKLNTQSPEILSKSQTVLPHFAIYINGIIAKLKYSNQTPSLLSNKITFNKNTINNKDVFGQTDLKVFRIYNRPLAQSEILRNFHSCITNEADRQAEINKNDLTSFSGITEVYFIRNTGSSSMPDRYKSARKSTVKNNTFEIMNKLVNKADSKSNVVNCTVIMVTKKIDETKINVYKNVEVTLQGTSTLAYAVKNYKMKIYDEEPKDPNKPSKIGKHKITLGNPIAGINQSTGTYNYTWKPEYTFTLKCDYMESSHMNNTGIARFINDKLYKGYTNPHKTPSQIDSGDEDLRIIIDGFPCILYQVDNADNAELINNLINDAGDDYDTINISTLKSNSTLFGSYMFNLDKAANTNYGFDLQKEVTDSEGNVSKVDRYPYLQSFEINANDSAGAAAFLPYDETRKNDKGESFASEYAYYLDTYEARTVYEETDLYDDADKITIGEYSDCVKIDTENNEYVVFGFPVFRKDESGFTDVTLTYKNQPESGKEYYRPCYGEDHLCLNGIIQTINYLNDTRVNKNPDYFKKFINVDFAIDYFIVTMSVGMVDNLGKNLMMNSWNIDNDGNPFNPKYINPELIVNTSNNAIRDDINICYWYPSFYDLDTCLGLDNFGVESVSVDAEPIIDKLSGYEFRSYMQIYENMSNVNEKYQELVDTTDGKQIQVNDQNISFENLKYLPNELLDTMLKIKHEDPDILNELSKKSASYSYIIILNGSQNVIQLTNSIELKSNDWYIFDPKTYKITTASQDKIRRYSLYSTAYSSLWNALLNNYFSQIYNDYVELRAKTLNVDNLLDKLSENTFDAIPKNYYNFNSQLKYLAPCSTLSSEQDIARYCNMCNGDREIKVKYWLKNRLNFVDTLIVNNLNMPNEDSDTGKSLIIFPYADGTKSLYIQTKQPQYISIQSDTSGTAIRKYVNNTLQDDPNYPGVKFDVKVNRQVQTHISGSRNMINFYSFASFDPSEITLSDMLYLKDISIATSSSPNTNIKVLTMPNANNVYCAFNTMDIHIKTDTFNTLDLSRCFYLNELDLSNCEKLQTLTLPDSGRIKSINLSGCKELRSLTISNLFQLTSLNLTNCVNLTNLTIQNAEKLKTLDLTGLPLNKLKIDNTGLSKISISSVNGTRSISSIDINDNITSFKLTSSQFTSKTTLDLSKCTKLNEVYCTDNVNLEKIILPKNTDDTDKRLGIANNKSLSTIGFNDDTGTETDLFKTGTCNLKYFRNGTTDKTIMTRINSSWYYFGGTAIEIINNLNTSNGYFYGASSLTTIKNSKINIPGGEVFRNTKIYYLDDTVTLTYDTTSSTKSLALCFYGSSNISMNAVKKVLKTVTDKPTNLQRFLFNAQFKDNSDRIINESLFDNINVSNADLLFASSNIISVTKRLFKTNNNIISGQGLFKSCTSLTNLSSDSLPNIFTDLRGGFYNCTSLYQPPSISNLTNLTNVDGLFCGCSQLQYSMKNLTKNILDTSDSNYISPKHATSNNKEGDFYLISTYPLINLTTAVGMYYNTKIKGVSEITVSGDGTTIAQSCFPEKYFKNNTKLKKLIGMFQHCSNITTILPNNFIDSSIVENVDGMFAYTNIYSESSLTDANNVLPANFFYESKSDTNILTSLGSPTVNDITTISEYSSETDLLKETSKDTDTNQSYYTITSSIDSFGSFSIKRRGLFEGSTIQYISPSLFDKLTKLTSVHGLFANCTRFKCFKDGTESIKNIFVFNTKLVNVSFLFFNTLINIPFDTDLFKTNTLIEYMIGTFAYNRQIKVDEIQPMIKIAHLKNLKNTTALYAGNMYYKLDGNTNNDLSNKDNLNNVFKELTNLSYTGFMFFRSGITITFSTDKLFNTNIICTQHMFDQCYYNNNQMSYLMYDLTSNGTDKYGFNKPQNHVAVNNTLTEYYKTNINAFGGILGKVPKYLFQDCLNLKKCTYMFAGTCLTGEIPSTIFDVTDNHNIVKNQYVGQVFKYKDDLDRDVISNNVYFYKDNTGKYVYGEYDSTNNQFIMNKYTDGSTEQRYSICENFEYSIDGLKETNAIYFNNITSVAFMFAMCTHLRNADPISEIDYTTSRYKQSTIPFKYNGYRKATSTDDITFAYVIDDIQLSFRPYNPDTDSEKTKFVLDNTNWQMTNSAIINDSTGDSIDVNYSRLYILHPLIFMYLINLESVTGFMSGCNELQGCLPNDIFYYNIKLKYASRFCADCYNLYGFYNKSLENNELHNIFYKPGTTSFNISDLKYMFYNCRQIGELIVNDELVSDSRVRPAKLSGSNYSDGFLAWTSTLGNFLLKNVTSIEGMFAYCSKLKGSIPKNMLTNSRYIRSDLVTRGAFAGTNSDLFNKGEGYSNVFTDNQALSASYNVELGTELDSKYFNNSKTIVND